MESLSPALSLLVPGASVTAVIVVVILFLRHIETSQAAFQKALVEQGERMASAAKILAEAHLEANRAITDRLDRLIIPRPRHE